MEPTTTQKSGFGYSPQKTEICGQVVNTRRFLFRFFGNQAVKEMQGETDRTGNLARIENFIFLRQGLHVRMTLDFWSSCAHLLRARMTGRCQQTRFMWCWGTDRVWHLLSKHSSNRAPSLAPNIYEN